MTDEQKKRRNTILAASVGSFLLPLAGLIVSLLFFARDDSEAGRTLLICAVLGVVFYVVVFGGL